MSDPVLAATLQAWRERGVDRFDPIRFRFIEALARRAGAHQGAVRRILDDKLARLLVAYDQATENASGAGRSAALERQASPTAPGPLGELVRHLAQQVSSSEEGVPASLPVAPWAASELKTLRRFKNDWSRLRADQRLRQALAKVPANAGPLNSNQLVHRCLVLMRELSPQYLDRFMAYVDTLSWIDQARGSKSG